MSENPVLHMYPWIASLREKDTQRHLCMGVLVHKSWVLTARHCLDSGRVGEVWIGGLEVNKAQQFVRRGVRRVETHISTDAALIELDAPVLDHLPLRVNGNPKLPAGRMCMTVGWGRMTNGSLAQTLQHAVLPLVDTAACESANGVPLNPRYDVCAGYQEGGVDACDGDSGAPLVVAGPSVQFLVALSSWGLQCALPRKYGVWIRADGILDFIQRHVPDLQAYDALASTQPGAVRLDVPYDRRAASASAAWDTWATGLSGFAALVAVVAALVVLAACARWGVYT